MRIALLSHESSLAHDTGRGHPERPDRIPAVVAGVRSSGMEIVDLVPSLIDAATLELVHEPGYIGAIERFCAAGGGALDPDTVAHAASWEAALRSAGAGPTAIDALRNDVADIAFIAMRPPGHHALPSRAMGFCLFNNIAIAARLLTDAGQRVAIVDWDVHHGNSTQDVFYDNPRVLYLSMHEFPAYPGTGWVHESGRGDGAGYTINIPWPTGTAGQAYKWGMDSVLMPVLAQYEPDWVLISAGYDAHQNDLLAGIRLVADDYAYMAGRLASVAPGRTVIFLEGGYDLEALTQSTSATLQGFASGSDDDSTPMPTRGPEAEIAELVIAEASQQWEL